ncbi:MAG TPA: helix-hairpin-helix domain-containing protein [Acidimicrobiia bacterium]|nr:helix-hairpin-helix domain-containing protein [Acidimicrobiia bacterium]
MSSRPPEHSNPLQRVRGLWVVVPSLVFGFFTWLSFLILGLRARRRDWILTGAAYGVYSALVFFALGRPEVENDDTANALLGAALFLAWFGGAIHTGFAYYAFARSPQAEGTAPAGWRPARGANPAAPAVDDLGLRLGNPAGEYLAASNPVATPLAGAAPLPPPVEANTAGQRTLARLPGVTPALARRWVAERNRRGGFRDIDDLAAALELQPHEIVRLRPRLSFAAQGGGPRRHLPGRGSGRVLDV